MKADLDRLLAARSLDALLIVSGEDFNAPRAYLTNGAHITGGYVIKRRDDAPHLFVNPMETEEAKTSGLSVHSYQDFGWADVIKASEGDRFKAEVEMIGRYLLHTGVTAGRIGVYGEYPAHALLALMADLRAAYPQYEFVGERGLSLFDEAYATKDADEIARLRSIGERTCAVVAQTWDFIASHRLDGDRVVDAAGQPLTIGMVKRFVRRALLDQDLEDSAMIFAQGRDGGFPHSRGEAAHELRAGQAIVFDLFPREIGGGYFHDMTRTWCIGHAPPEVQTAYDQVMNAFDVAVDSFRPNMPAKALQEAVQDYFESLGHPTSRSQPGTNVGYVHSLGHGIGLNIHERPGLGHLSKDTLPPGSVITIEPGLYYPERGFGIRIEDSFVVTESGELVSLTPFHKDLILPLSG